MQWLICTSIHYGLILDHLPRLLLFLQILFLSLLCKIKLQNIYISIILISTQNMILFINLFHIHLYYNNNAKEIFYSSNLYVTNKLNEKSEIILLVTC